MKQAVIQKAAGTPATGEQLAKINRFSRRELSAEEVYVFSLLLCDNEVDRDYERFPLPSLEKLAALFVGKTGIFDHNPRGENQTARIFETAVEADESRLTAAGEPYAALRAWAYMVRCDKNADLILEIDAGIKKEVSVGCAVERAECSVCGADVRERPCAHEAGHEYGGALCWHDLINPTDAYEWSFVAVPDKSRQKKQPLRRLTFEGLFCDIAQCKDTPGGSYCEDGYCSQRRVWERLKTYEDAEEQGLLVRLPFVAMVEQSLQGGKMHPQKDQKFNGRYAVVYTDKKKWASPLIDICGTQYNREEAEERMMTLVHKGAEAALKEG